MPVNSMGGLEHAVDLCEGSAWVAHRQVEEAAFLAVGNMSVVSLSLLLARFPFFCYLFLPRNEIAATRTFHKIKKPTYALYFHMYSQMPLHMFQLYQAIIRGSKVYMYLKVKQSHYRP
jgi:hypothetical protein